MKQRTMLLTMMLLGLALVLTSGISGLAQSKKKGKPSGGNNPTPIGIQVAEPVNRDEAKVKLVAGNVRQAGGKVFADVQWEFFAPQGSRVETVDVKVIGDFGNGAGVSETRSFGAVNSGSLFLSEVAQHPASDFRSLNITVVVNFRDLSNNELFAKGTVKNFSVSVKPSAPAPAPKPVTIKVLPAQPDGARVRVNWDVTLPPGNFIDHFEVTAIADLERGVSTRQEALGSEIRNANARLEQFDFSRFGSPGAPVARIAKIKTVVIAFVGNQNGVNGRVIAEREDVFPPPPLPVVNLSVTDLKTGLNNIVSVNWAINGDSPARILGFEVKLATTFSNNTAIIPVFQAASQARSFTKTILPPNGPPNGFRQILATITAKLEDPATGRKFDVVASRKLN